MTNKEKQRLEVAFNKWIEESRGSRDNFPPMYSSEERYKFAYDVYSEGYIEGKRSRITEATADEYINGK